MSRAWSGEPARRAAAATVLCGASLTGWWLGGRSSKAIAAAVLSVAIPGALALACGGTRHPRRLRRPTGALPTSRWPWTTGHGRDRRAIANDILIPARDEERHIAALLGDLGRQDVRSVGGPACLRVTVIDDGSIDRTAPSPGKPSTQPASMGDIRRTNPGRTKGDVLRDVPAEAIDGSALLVVLDADARRARLPGPRRRASCGRPYRLHRPTPHRPDWADRFWLGRLQDDEQALDSWTLAGRIGLGGGGELRGNGMVVTQQALAAAGGWPAGALTEDLELSTALLGAGVPIAWSGDVVLEETVAATLAALTRQRLRWAEGSARRFLDRVPAVLADRRAPGAARLELAVYAGRLGALPPLVLGAACRGLARGSVGPAAVLLGAYVGVGSVMAWAAIARLQERAPRVMRLVRAVTVAASTHWLIALPVGLVHIAVGPKTVTFARTTDRLTPRDGDLLGHPNGAMTVSLPKHIAACVDGLDRRSSHRGSMSTSIRDMRANSTATSVAEQAEETIRSRGSGALVPYQLATDKRRFVAPDGGVVVSGTYGRFEVALGDPISIDDPAASMAAFVAGCRARDQVPAVYQASSGSLPALAALGMRTFRVGHEAIVPLADFTLKTPRRANLRHTLTRARRGGVTFAFSHGLDGGERARASCRD